MRIGAVSYLNTKPLVHRLSQLAPQHELIFDLPSRLADDLAAGRLDVALIPSVEFFRRPDYQIVSDACIACRGPVWSVQLFSRVPLPQIRSLALDEGSRTSAVLVQVLLRRLVGITPDLRPFPIDEPPEAVQADALLMIGDRAMQPPDGPLVARWDLGEVWCAWTGLPFVFAMWVARRPAKWSPAATSEPLSPQDTELDELARVLASARDEGLKQLEQIAAEEHAAARLSLEQCLAYFRQHLYFFLGPREWAGLRRFYEEAAALGLLPEGQAGRLARKDAQAVEPAWDVACTVSAASATTSQP